MTCFPRKKKKKKKISRNSHRSLFHVRFGTSQHSQTHPRSCLHSKKVSKRRILQNRLACKCNMWGKGNNTFGMQQLSRGFQKMYRYPWITQQLAFDTT